MKIIRTNIGMPPHGITYTDPRTPAAQWNDETTWLSERVGQVIKFRLANPGVYPEPEWTEYSFVSNQIVEFNCPRYPAGYCLEIGVPVSLAAPAPAPQSTRICPACNVGLVPTYCGSCGGRMVTGYKCPKCGKAFPR
jgi:hypothetical protein